jgi:type II secretory pathway pseudopilin PulG
MPFQFTCPYCFKKTLVDEAISGQSGPCAGCGKTIVVPEPPAKLPHAIQPVNRPRVEIRVVRTKRKVLAWGAQVVGLVAAIAVIFSVSIYLLWPTLSALKARRDRVASLNNLQRIAEALNAYAVQHGSYPSPIVYDTNGKPLYSWRVLILEQLGEAQLAANFRRDLAWDAPENAILLSQCPKVFMCPTLSKNQIAASANYALITGNNTLFPTSGPLTFSQISDGRDRTLLVAEVDLAGGEWSQPWDIDIAKLNTRIGFGGVDAIGGNHAGGGAIAFADGTPGWLPEDLSPALLRGLISPAGGEAIDPAPFTLK